MSVCRGGDALQRKDGHGGSAVAQFAAKYLPEDGIAVSWMRSSGVEISHDQVLRRSHSGTLAALPLSNPSLRNQLFHKKHPRAEDPRK